MIPFAPISKYARELLAECGDATPLAWLRRDQRFVEKLATPDVTIADLIGDVDPIKAARGGHLLSDELTMHFGLLPRANRGIFAINELPDLSGKVQVGLFNIMQEGDVQIKGYPVRLPLDVLLAFTANPEDYTARGKIITPLKDRIGSEVITHYPRTVQLGMEITTQEAWTERGGPSHRRSPTSCSRSSSGSPSKRGRTSGSTSGPASASVCPISVWRTPFPTPSGGPVALGEDRVVPRVSDVYAAVPSITGKLELEYEGELQGGDTIARDLIRRAAGRVMEDRMGGADLAKIVAWFDQGGALKVSGDERSDLCLQGFGVVPGLLERGVGVRPGHDQGCPSPGSRLRAGAGGPGGPETDQPQRRAGLHPGKAGAAGAGIREGGDFVWVTA